MKNQEKKNWVKPEVKCLSIKKDTFGGSGAVIESGNSASNKQLLS